MKLNKTRRPSIFLLGLISAFAVTSPIGCEKKDQDAAMAQGQVVMSKAKDLASTVWKSACEQASKLNADSSKDALESAKKKLSQAEGEIADLKAKSNLDSLKLDSVKAQLRRLDAALNIQKLKSQMEERVQAAQKLEENTEKSVGDVKAKLAAADASYRELSLKLESAQEIYDSATEKVKFVTDKIQNL